MTKMVSDDKGFQGLIVKIYGACKDELNALSIVLKVSIDEWLGGKVDRKVDGWLGFYVSGFLLFGIK